MNRIDKKFLELKTKNKKALIVYLTVGFPNVLMTEKLVLALAEAGVDIFELGVPFSDPLADGPIIQEASAYALKRGVDLRLVFSLLQRLRSKIANPLLLMGYYNQIFQFGINHFASVANKRGLDGLIIPDLPIDESGQLDRALSKNKIYLINFIAPTTEQKRIKTIVKKSQGFIYYVSLTGTTGPRIKLPVDIKEKVNSIKKITNISICVGFGISTKQQFRYISSFSDGVIIGSALISKIKENIGNKNLVSIASRFIKNLIS